MNAPGSLRPRGDAPGSFRPGWRALLGGAVLALVIGAITSCGGTTTLVPGTGSEGGDRLLGHTYLSTEVTEAGKPRPLAPKTRISLRFSDDGRLHADAGCNSMSGPVDLGDATIDAGTLATTEMGCDPPRHAQDSWLADLLAAKPGWRLEGHRLVLTSGDTRIVLLDRKIADPDRPLAKTRWEVTTLVEGDVASSMPNVDDTGRKAYLVFADGRVEGSDGCNQLTGPATVLGDRIEFGPLTSTKMACLGDLARVQQVVLAVLDGAVDYRIDADQLHLEHPGGQGLVLTARGSDR